ncbi:MAG: DUF2927 domain-containing protein, partial [Paracoccaceae bacterium]
MGARDIRRLRRAALTMALLLLAACDPASFRATGGLNATTPEQTALPPESQELSRYYTQIEAGFLTQGLLRRDGGGPDVPFTARNLVDNFIRIALFEEYTTIGNRIVAQQTPSQLHKWDQPVRMKVVFGDTVPQAQRVQDRQGVTR